MRVVLDSNVVVSALAHPRGRVSPLLRAAQERRYQLLVSPAIISEVAETLRDDFLWEDSHIIRRLKRITKRSEIIVPRIVLAVIKDDPDDDRILECAVTGKADVIVSGDRHLLRLKSYEGIPIVRPVDFLRTLGLS